MGCHRDSPLLGRWHAIGVALGKRGKRSGEKEKGPLEGSLNQRVTWKKETRLSAVSAGVAGRGEGGGAPPAPVFYRFTLSPLLLGGPSPLSPPPSLPPLRPCFYQLEPPFASLSPPFSPSPLRPPFPRSPLSPLRDRYNTTGNLSPLLSRHCQPFCQVRCSCYGLDVMRCFEFSFSCQLLACKVD